MRVRYAHDAMRPTYLLRTLTVYRCVAYVFASILFLYAIRRWLAHRVSTETDIPQPLREYCDVLDFTLHGDEGSIPPSSDLQLYSVHIVTRHGARTAIEPLDHPWEIRCSSAASARLTEADRKLLAFFRATAKDGVTRQKKDKELDLFDVLVEEKDFDCAERGALWPYGHAQMIRLGKYLIDRYQNQAELIAKQSSGDQATGKVVVKPTTTHVERTFQSAEALLFGMLNDEDWLNADLRDSYSHVFCDNSICARCEQEGNSMAFEAYLSLIPAFEQDSNYLKLRKHFTEMHMDKEIFKDPLRIFDTAMAYICTGQGIPCDQAATSCFQPHHIDRLKRRMDKILHAAHGVVGSQARKSCVLLAQPFLTRLVASIESIIDNSSLPVKRIMRESDVELPVHYFSAHDTTLMPVIAALKMRNLVGVVPPYASRLVFEAYRYSVTKRWLVRVIFNGIDVTHVALDHLTHAEVIGRNGHKLDFIDFEDLALWVREGMFLDAGWPNSNLKEICAISKNN